MKSLAVLAVLVALGCGGGEAPRGGLDAPGNAFDGAPGDAAQVTLPTWMLEDVQPQSPRAGQIYGLDAFAGKIVVVTLLEGF